MKQMRSRFRFIALILVCAFLLTFGLCSGAVLKAAGVSLASLRVPAVLVSASPDPSVSVPDGNTPALPEATPGPDLPTENDNPVNTEYNTFGL